MAEQPAKHFLGRGQNPNPDPDPNNTIHTLSKTLLSFSNEIDILQQKYDDLKRMTNTLQTQLQQLHVQNDDLRTQNNELRTQNDDLRTQNDDLRTQNDKLLTQNNELHTHNNDLRTQNDKLLTQNNELHTQNNTPPQNDEQTIELYKRQEIILLRQYNLHKYKNDIQNKHSLFYADSPVIILSKPTQPIQLLNIQTGEIILPQTISPPPPLPPRSSPLINSANTLLTHLIHEFPTISYMKKQNIHQSLLNACIHLTDSSIVLSKRCLTWTHIDKNYISFLSRTLRSMIYIPQHELMLTFKFLFIINGYQQDAYIKWLGPSNHQYFDFIDSLSLDSIDQNIIDYLMYW